MAIFSKYADYYNLFYAEKDYKAEADYIDSLIKQYSEISVNHILNIGCGTGNHDQFLVDYGYQIDAFDMSEKMIKTAKSKKISNANFFVANTNTFFSDKKYDCIISLFHVLSYHINNDAVNKMFEIVKNNLKPGGIFIFDCWSGVGVLNDPPVVRVKDFDTVNEKILRIAIPEMHYELNVVDVNYRLKIEDRITHVTNEVIENHKMRYFFQTELLLYAKNNALEIDFFYEWMTRESLNKNSWNMCFSGKLK